MTPTETARAALQKALDALPDPPMPRIGEGFTRGAVIRLMQPARLAIEQALAALPADEPPAASMDEKALEIARRAVTEGACIANPSQLTASHLEGKQT